MKKFHELPKDILVQLLVNVNNLSLISDEELFKRQQMIADEVNRRTYRNRCDVIKKSLLQLQSLPHLKDFIIKNLEIINSIEAVSDTTITINQIAEPFVYARHPFLQSLSSLYIVPNACSKSLLTNIYEYSFSGKTHDSYWLRATKIDYKVCETCRKQEYRFSHESGSCSIVLYEGGELYSFKQPKLIEFCETCEKVHCIHHICKT